MILGVVIAGLLAQGCSKDTDCKGDRICEAGACVSPAAPPAPPPPPPPPPVPADEATRYPLVVRRDGKVCVQSLDASGQVQESCRPEGSSVREPLDTAKAGELPPRPPRKGAPGAEPEPEGIRVSTDVLFGGGLMTFFGGGGVALFPQGTAYLAVGGVGPSGVGGVGVLSGNIGFGPGGALFVVGLAPGLRVGKSSHAIISLGPTVVASTASRPGIAGTLMFQGVIPLAGGFVLAPQTGFHFDASGLLLTAALGLGFSSL